MNHLYWACSLTAGEIWTTCCIPIPGRELHRKCVKFSLYWSDKKGEWREKLHCNIIVFNLMLITRRIDFFSFFPCDKSYSVYLYTTLHTCLDYSFHSRAAFNIVTGSVTEESVTYVIAHLCAWVLKCKRKKSPLEIFAFFFLSGNYERSWESVWKFSE